MIKSINLEYIRNFYEVLYKLMDFLISKFPDDPKAKLYKRKVEMTRRMNTRLVISEFIKNMGEYESKIMEKDAKYFENLDYNLNFDKDDIQDVFRLRNLWVNTNDNESKEFVFKSLQDLYYYAHLLGY